MKRVVRSLYFWVLFSIFAGGVLGVISPSLATQLKPLGDGFVSVLKFLVGPLIFCSVSLGIAGSTGKKAAGRIGLKALVYFEVVSTLALLIGLFVANILKPGEGFPVPTEALDLNLIKNYTTPHGTSMLNPIKGGVNLIQILILAITVGIGLLFVPFERRSGILVRLRRGNDFLFYCISKWMVLAPIGAGAAMAFTMAKFGVSSLRPLVHFMLCFYLTCALFIFGVLGLILRSIGISIGSFLRYLKSEILLVLGTSSSESALGPLMQKLENLGCDKSVVGLVVPTGYSFNLDGTNIYLTLACLFIAQAFSVHLSLTQQISILLVAMLSSKGASGVTGAGFITLAATLSVVPEVPVVGLTLILGVDRFMSEARALTNMIGNGIACLVIARSEGALDLKKLKGELKHPHAGMLDA